MTKTTDAHSLFEDTFDKPVFSRFDSRLRSSDGGASLLGVIDRRFGLTESLCAHLTDGRAAGRVAHSYPELVRQRYASGPPMPGHP